MISIFANCGTNCSHRNMSLSTFVLQIVRLFPKVKFQKNCHFLISKIGNEMKGKGALLLPEDLSIEKIRAIYRNSLAKSITNNCATLESNFVPQEDTLAQRIAQQYVIDFLISHRMNNAALSIKNETNQLYEQQHSKKWICRKLQLSSKQPLFKQIREDLDIQTVTQTQESAVITALSRLPKPAVSLTATGQNYEKEIDSQDMSQFTALLESQAPSQEGHHHTSQSKGKHHHHHHSSKSGKSSTTQHSTSQLSNYSRSSKSALVQGTLNTPELTSLQTKTRLPTEFKLDSQQKSLTTNQINLEEEYGYDGVNPIGPLTEMMQTIRKSMNDRVDAYTKLPIDLTTTIQQEESKTKQKTAPSTLDLGIPKETSTVSTNNESNHKDNQTNPANNIESGSFYEEEEIEEEEIKSITRSTHTHSNLQSEHNSNNNNHTNSDGQLNSISNHSSHTTQNSTKGSINNDLKSVKSQHSASYHSVHQSQESEKRIDLHSLVSEN